MVLRSLIQKLILGNLLLFLLLITRLALTRDDREKSRLVQRRPASTPLGWAACFTSFPRLYSLLAYPGPLRESSWFGSSVIALTSW